MKKNSLLMIAAAILMTACGTAAQYTGSSGTARFEDGIYSSNPSFKSKSERQALQSQTDALVEQTRTSEIYLFGDKKDTVAIPENMSAVIRYDREKGNTIVAVGENPYDWRNNIDPWAYYTPYSIGSSWYWSRHFDPWYSSSWYWNTWAYTPWRYSGWYDPLYAGGWYDPWYYGYAGWYGGWYSPWYGYYPHYCGWYGGWDPYYDYYHHHHHHHHHHVTYPVHDDRWNGARPRTGTERAGISSSTPRAQSGRTAAVSRTAGDSRTASVSRSTSASRVTSATKVTPSRTAPSRTSPSRASAATGNKTQGQTYRRPQANTSATVSGTPSRSRDQNGSPAYRTPDSQTRREPSVNTHRSSSTTSRSSYSSGSSYRSGSSSRSSGGYSGGGSSRSGGSYSGGGASRSGGRR